MVAGTLRWMERSFIFRGNSFDHDWIHYPSQNQYYETSSDLIGRFSFHIQGDDRCTCDSSSGSPNHQDLIRKKRLDFGGDRLSVQCPSCVFPFDFIRREKNFVVDGWTVTPHRSWTISPSFSSSVRRPPPTSTHHRPLSAPTQGGIP